MQCQVRRRAQATRRADIASSPHNRRARFDYYIEDTLQAGIVLTGTEVKSLREGRASLQGQLCR